MVNNAVSGFWYLNSDSFTATQYLDGNWHDRGSRKTEDPAAATAVAVLNLLGPGRVRPRSQKRKLVWVAVNAIKELKLSCHNPETMYSVLYIPDTVT